MKKNTHGSSRKNIKMAGDPFKNVESRPSNSKLTDNSYQPNHDETSRDDNILNNLDRMLSSLQMQ